MYAGLELTIKNVADEIRDNADKLANSWAPTYFSRVFNIGINEWLALPLSVKSDFIKQNSRDLAERYIANQFGDIHMGVY